MTEDLGRLPSGSHSPPHATSASLKQKPTPKPQPKFFFVDSGEGKAPTAAKESRRNARSFVMAKARRARPWSTSKHGSATSRDMRSWTDNDPPARLKRDKRSQDPAAASDTGDFVNYWHPQQAGPLEHRYPKTVCVARGCFWISKSASARCLSCGRTRAQSTAQGKGDRFTFFGQGKLDPFNVGSTILDSRCETLAAHWLNVQSSGILDIDVFRRSTVIRNCLYQLALESSGAMHAMLCTAALHRLMFGKATLADALAQKCLAIQAINETLSKSGSSLSDSSVYAVSTLVCIEEGMTDPRLTFEPAAAAEENRQRRIHFEGLKRMLRMRGGLEGLSSNPVLQILLTWHVGGHYIISGKAPYLNLSCWDSQELYPNPRNVQYPASYFAMQQLCVDLELPPVLLKHGLDIALWVVEVDEWFQGMRLQSEPLYIQHRGMLLVIRCLNFLNDASRTEDPDAMEDVFCMSLIGFQMVSASSSERGLLKMQPWCRKRLKEALLRSEAEDWTHCPDFLGWVLTVAALRDLGGPTDESWFIAQLQKYCRVLNISSVDQLLAKLKRYPWMVIRLDDAVVNLWDQIYTSLPSPRSENLDAETSPDMDLGVLAGLETSEARNEASYGRWTAVGHHDPSTIGPPLTQQGNFVSRQVERDGDQTLLEMTPSEIFENGLGEQTVNDIFDRPFGHLSTEAGDIPEELFDCVLAPTYNISLPIAQPRRKNVG